jgi:hypothetical protein
MKIANKNARDYVLKKVNFEGSNLRGQWEGSLYIVYSYGWYAIIIWDSVAQEWLINKNKYSRSTSRHISNCLPYEDEIFERNYLSKEEMREYVYTKKDQSMIA